jgi:hypothetical protein
MAETQKKKPTFEPLVPLGIFLVIFGAVITAVPIMPESWLGNKEILFADKIINITSGLAFLTWGGAWFYVGWKRTQRAKAQSKE